MHHMATSDAPRVPAPVHRSKFVTKAPDPLGFVRLRSAEEVVGFLSLHFLGLIFTRKIEQKPKIEHGWPFGIW